MMLPLRSVVVVLRALADKMGDSLDAGGLTSNVLVVCSAVLMIGVEEEAGDVPVVVVILPV
jgi:hypothetical protein